jgi:hypothetical protein
MLVLVTGGQPRRAGRARWFVPRNGRVAFDRVLVHRVLVDRLLLHGLLVDRVLVDRVLVDRVLVDRLLVDRLLVDRLLVDRPLVDRLLVHRPLVDRLLVGVGLADRRRRVVGGGLPGVGERGGRTDPADKQPGGHNAGRGGNTHSRTHVVTTLQRAWRRPTPTLRRFSHNRVARFAEKRKHFGVRGATTPTSAER